MKFINFFVVKISVSFAVGITINHFIPLSFSFILKSLCLLCLLLLIVWVRERKTLVPGTFFGLLVYLIFTTLGCANYAAQQPKNTVSHYSKFPSENTSELLQLKITEVLKPNAYYQKYSATVMERSGHHTTGNILLSVAEDSVSNSYTADDLLLVDGRIQNILPPLNPHQFDYRKYLQHQGIYHQILLSPTQIHTHKKGKTTPRGFAYRLRQHVILKLSKEPIGQDERSIMQALLLGERNDIDKDLYSQYAAAGALHILAVSGLHVGILFLLFSRLLSPLEALKFGKHIKIILVVVLLWSFALLAGLSPSVVRAVTMFSFFALAGLLKRPTSGFNTLFLSFIVLLIANPNWLFHVGFQFSYLAVFAILWIQPKLYKLYIPKFQLDKQLWSITTVTIAAQLGIAPLSIYYFHQFPGLFFLSNLVILPFLGILLTAGILVILLSVFNALPYELALAYSESIAQLNGFIGWVARQDAYLFTDLSLSVTMLLCLYLLIITSLYYWMHRNKRRFRRLLFAFVVLLSANYYERSWNKAEELIVFQVSRSTVIGHRSGTRLRLFEKEEESFIHRYPVKDFRIGSAVVKTISEAIPDVFRFNGETYLCLNNAAAYPSEEIDILLLTDSPKVHLGRLIDSLKPKKIVADGSNYRSDVNRWRITCESRNISFHHTGTDGAYVVKNESVK